MPGFGETLWRELGFDPEREPLRWEEIPTWVPAGRAIAPSGGEYFAHRSASESLGRPLSAV